MTKIHRISYLSAAKNNDEDGDLAECGQLHDNPDGRRRTDSDQTNDMRMIKLQHRVCTVISTAYDRCTRANVLHTKVDAQCDKLATELR